MTALLVAAAFAITYLVMATGRLPMTQVGRTAVALGAACVVALVTGLAGQGWVHHVEWPVLAALAGLMMVGVAFEEVGGYRKLGVFLKCYGHTPARLLALVVLVSGGLSMLLINDVVVFALVPVVCAVCKVLAWSPRPHLLALAASANAGSAASLIGNPQNILIAEVGGLGFLAHWLYAVVPSLISLLLVFFVIRRVMRPELQTGAPFTSLEPSKADLQLGQPARQAPLLGVCALLVGVVCAYMALPALGYVAALAAGVLATVALRLPLVKVLRGVDTKLLLLITALFVVTGAFAQLPGVQVAFVALQTHGWLPSGMASTAAFALLASNTIGNVPAVMLLLQSVGPLPQLVLMNLALFSALAGNLLITASLANIIVAEQAGKQGQFLGFLDFLRVGLPITLLSFGLVSVYLFFVS